jgi:hypothetical protein
VAGRSISTGGHAAPQQTQAAQLQAAAQPQGFEAQLQAALQPQEGLFYWYVL